MSPADRLHGLRVLITRPAGQADRLHSLIAAAGGRPVRLPAIEILDTLTPRHSVERFGVILRVDFYQPEDLEKIVLRSARLLEIPIKKEGAFEIARRSRGTPSSSVWSIRTWYPARCRWRT